MQFYNENRECTVWLKSFKNDYLLIVFFKSPDSINDWQFFFIKREMNLKKIE